MKRRISKKPFEEMIKKYPISNLLDGWFFKCWEVSNGHYIAEGSDQYGRIVSCEGSNADDILQEIVIQTKEIGL